MVTAADLFAVRRAARDSKLASLRKAALSREELTTRLRDWITGILANLEESLSSAAASFASEWRTPTLTFVNPGFTVDGMRHFSATLFRHYILECGLDPLACFTAAVGDGIKVVEDIPWAPDASSNPYLPQDVSFRYRFYW